MYSLHHKHQTRSFLHRFIHLTILLLSSTILAGQVEIPGNNVDEDNNGFIDCYQDNDNDGYGSNTVVADAYPVNTTTCGASSSDNLDDDKGDCNDNNPSIHPDALEVVADGIDSNCDGEEICFFDNDRDTQGNINGATIISTDIDCNDASESYNTLDCDDNDPNNFEGNVEVLDGQDNNCNNQIDEGFLPVELVSFSVKISGQNLLLEWETTNEKENLGFEILRANRYNQWKEISFIPGQNNDYQINQYTYLDTAPLKGQNRYRLRQVDISGAISYSPVRVIDFSLPSSRLIAYPNPMTSNQLTIDLPSTHTGAASYKIYNSLGQQVHWQQIHLKNSQSALITLPLLRNGQYAIHLWQENTFIGSAFIIVNH